MTRLSLTKSRCLIPAPLSLSLYVWPGLLSSLENPSNAHEESQARALSELLTFITTHLETRHHHDHRHDHTQAPHYLTPLIF